MIEIFKSGKIHYYTFCRADGYILHRVNNKPKPAVIFINGLKMHYLNGCYQYRECEGQRFEEWDMEGQI